MINERESKFISVVARVCNDKTRIRPFLDAVMGACSLLFEKCELILVDDASTDNTAEEIRTYYEERPAGYMVSLVKLGIPHGLESAMNAGRDLAIGDFIARSDDEKRKYSNYLRGKALNYNIEAMVKAHLDLFEEMACG